MRICGRWFPANLSEINSLAQRLASSSGAGAQSLNISVMGVVTTYGTIKLLAEFGLIFSFWHAAFESKQNEIGLAELRLGAFGWLATFTLALGFVNLLYLLGLMRSPLLFALILPPTAFGVLIPILEALLEEHFGGEYAAYRARTSGLIPGIY